MELAVAQRLIELNREFYKNFGREFSSTRQRLQPGVKRVLEMLAGSESILDLGCGNGELTRELMRRDHRGQYAGVDFSRPLLEVARQGWEDLPATFLCADLAAPDWDKKVLASVNRPFDLVFAFAVLHHIPEQGRRLNLLSKAHALLREGGRFIHSEWQFLNSGKLKSRVQPWSEIGLSAADVDADDYLLDWRGGGRGLRYVHHFSEAELEALAVASGFRVREGFLSDGENNRLGLYQVWEAV